MELCHKSLEDTLIQMEEEIKDGEIMISISYLVACELLKEILESVDYLHRQNPPIIHGKLNSKNILITLGMNGRFIKLSNFFSKLTEILDDTSDARENRRSKYIAREYEYGEYDTKADIYSLGVVINDLFSSFKKMYIIKKYYSNNPNNLNLTNLPKYYQVIELE
jgi:serine/threonine protein kinase